MSAIVLLLLGLGGMAAGYLLYSRFIATRIYKLDPNFRTPAHEYEDGVDFVPTNRFVLWGHHFTSVAGAAPIVGPAIAVIWGWLPAFLWVVLGTVFFAGVHDSGALWASVRNRAKSVGSLTGEVVGRRARTVFMIVIFLVLLMVNAVFGVVIAKLLINNPGAVVPVWGAIAVALVIGQLIYRRVIGLGVVSVVGVIALYSLIYIGPQVPVELPQQVMGLSANASWILLLFGYAAIASLLPVWVLLQPRDYINGLQLFVGLILLYGAVLIGNPQVVAPMINHDVPAGTPSLLPLLFVTIACGAISGWHSLVSSSGTARQIEKESDALPVGGGAMWMEMVLAVISLLTATAATGGWEAFKEAYSSGKFGVFAVGLATFLNKGSFGLISTEFGQAYGMVFLTIMGLTICYLVVRFMRVASAELLGSSVPALKNIHIGAIVALVLSLIVIWTGVWQTIWVLFGGANQMMASLALLIITLWLMSTGKKYAWTLWPFVFMYITTIGALVYTAFWKALPAALAGTKVTGNIIAVVVAVILLGCALILGYDGLMALNRHRKGKVAVAAK